MMEMNDDELQQWLENKQPGLESDELSDDAKAYQTLFEALGEEPINGLPYDFMAKVTRRIQANVKRSNELRWNLLAAAIFTAAISVVCGLVVLISPANINSLLHYKWVLLLLPLVFIAIQYFDQMLVKARIFNSN